MSSHAVFVSLLLAWIGSRVACCTRLADGSVRDLSASDVNGLAVVSAENIDRKAGPRMFRFHVINNSTLPLNLLGLPSTEWAQFASHVKNNVAPGEGTEFLASFVTYELHASIADGQRQWRKSAQGAWGLVKYASSAALKKVAEDWITIWSVGAATAAVAYMPPLAAPMLVWLAAVAASTAVASFASMALTSFSDALLEFGRQTIQSLLKKPSFSPQWQAGSGELTFNFTKSAGDILGLWTSQNVRHGTLDIDSIQEGVIQTWNNEHPSDKVFVGDRIVEVNGERGDLSRMLGAIKDASCVSLKLARGEFPLEVQKKQGQLLGAWIFRTPDEQALRISAIQEEGPLKSWNDGHPLDKAMPGDIITEVNGIRGDAALMAKEVVASHVLHMRIKRDSDRNDERFLSFFDVVPEDPIRNSVKFALPDVDLEKAIMTMATAERYMQAAQSDFSATKMARAQPRHFVITGGFIKSSDLISHDGSTWPVLDFIPLQIGEVHPRAGCRMPDSENYWQDKYKECQDMCKSSRQRSMSYHLAFASYSICLKSCSSSFKVALAQERALANSKKWALFVAQPGRQVQILDSSNQTLLSSSNVPLLQADAGARMAAAGQSGQIIQLNVEAGTALVNLNSSGKTLEFPFEVLVPYVAKDDHGTTLLKVPGNMTLFASGDRSTILAPRHGQCWSKCCKRHGGSVWGNTHAASKFLATLGRPLWCYARSKYVNDATTDDSPIGSLCLSDDDCGNVEEEGTGWLCSDDCG
eukprot:TRINITY_DN45448_c0_g1_i1.p1 TRINITY_DN45448_c0_g1~~TRINITY_DN45448_c0_g1_i1.p1  ORF type:complete len:754 (-),score=128.05 TRINITY_DN45448_c0_g1_i1:81-2342(-)